ncbi:MAG: hypothetical protein N2513_00700 [Deltaproteobacteria bacterium]|nr:hypothetical protein [Deltaproteobacteria bacterium]
MKRLDIICQLIFNIYEAYTVAIYKLEGKFLRCLSFFTMSKTFLRDKYLSVEMTLPGWVMKHREPLIIPNFDREIETLGYYEKNEEIKSFMGFPLGESGVLCIDSKKKYSFTDKEKRNLSGFVPLIIQEISVDDYGVELEERLTELNTKRLIFSLFGNLLQKKIKINDVLEEALRISGGDLCFIGMEKGEKLEIKDAAGIGLDQCLKKTCSIGESIAYSVIEGGAELLLPFDTGYLREKPLIYEGEPFKAKQFFGFPLVVDDIVFGVVGFATRTEKPLLETSIGTLRDMAVMFSMYYSAVWTKEYLEKLKDIDPVTGALQFNYFLRIAEEFIKKNIKFGLIKISLLKLSAFNREKGVDFTEQMLKKACYLIRHSSGETSFVSRKAGGKFYVLIPRRDPPSVKNTAKMIDYTIFKGIYEPYEGKTKFQKKEESVYSKVVFFPEDGVQLCTLLDKIDG